MTFVEKKTKKTQFDPIRRKNDIKDKFLKNGADQKTDDNLREREKQNSKPHITHIDFPL